MPCTLFKPIIIQYFILVAVYNEIIKRVKFRGNVCVSSLLVLMGISIYDSETQLE